MIALVDYGMGNLRSVEKALTRVGADVRIVSDRGSVLTADALVLPGVGAFGDCLKNLEKLDLAQATREFIASKRPFLGICLGMQGLFESSEETPGVNGLGVFEGTVPRFDFSSGSLRACDETVNAQQAGMPASTAAQARMLAPRGSGGLKVPHMGWNQLRIRKADCPLLAGIADGSYVYFVHSYYCAPTNKSLMCATTAYGIEFCSMLWSGSVFATQFHPEKSQAVGLKMLENFVKLQKPGVRSQESE
ncbi:MAG: imidazole glycerol phosphate synthase subunit HisH [Verrucomicrobiia bacterium]